MRWLLAGYCWLALIDISVAFKFEGTIIQKPRFFGVKTRNRVGIFCIASEKIRGLSTQWYKSNVDVVADRSHARKIVEGQRFNFQSNKKNQNAILVINDVRIEDSGVYFCDINGTLGPGTAVQVAKHIDIPQAEYRSKMKDGLIVLQGLVVAVCIAAVLLRKQHLVEKKDSIYEEPETDHIYEGLAIETCGGGLYEELSVYAQAEGAEAPWE